MAYHDGAMNFVPSFFYERRLMIFKRISVPLEKEEHDLLFQMAMDDLRSLSDEMRHILRLEMARRFSDYADPIDVDSDDLETTQEIKI